MRRFLLLWVAPIALIALVAVWPLASGARTLILRDVLNTHLALRSHLADSIRSFELPLIDPLRAGGQGLIGNPNAVALYPDNLLLLFTSTLYQLNAHFWLHVPVALLSMLWLGRRWGLSREGAWAAAVVYASSGYFLAQMNLYNAVAAAALAPALAAALLAAAEPDRRGRSLAALGAVWALVLLGGDPVLAAIALGWSLVFAARAWREVPWGGVAVALGCGLLVAAPQYVEMLRLLPGSFRGFWGNEAAALIKTTPDPRALIDLLVPTFFGRPDLVGSWSDAYFGGVPPLYFSLAPGLVALAAAVAGARAGKGEARTRLALAIVAAALVLGFSRPWLGEVLARLPGGGLFRFPVKFVLGAALAGALLAGRGFERLVFGHRRTWARALALLAGAELALFALFAAGGNPLERGFRALFAGGVGDGLFETLRRGWAGLAIVQLWLAIAALVVLALGRRATAVTLLVLQAGSQLVLLNGLLPTDEAAIYRNPPAVLDEIPPGAVLAHGGAVDAFVRGYPMSPHLPDRQSFRLWRRAHSEAFGFAGLAAGRRYELVVSAEGLDSFLSQATALGLRSFDDRRRVAVLAATGVDVLLLPRPLDLAALGGVEPLFRSDGADPLHVYRVERALDDAQLLGDVRFAPHVQAAFDVVFERDFDPRRTAVVAGEGEPRAAPGGRVEIERFGAEEIAVEVESEAGGFVVVRRAWLPIWRAEIDGERATVRIADLTRLAVEVPPGAHRVRFHVSRTPFRIALGATLAGLFGLILLARRR